MQAWRWRLVFLGLMACFGAGPARAEPADAPSLFPEVRVETGGSLRLRYEWKQGFSLGRAGAVDPQDYLLSQLRVHLGIHRGERWRLLLEGQDARLHSAFLRNTVDDRKTPNIFADRFDLHRGWLQLGWRAWGGGQVRAGRQKFNFGRQRLVASLEWVNTARVWDGLRVTQSLGAKRTLDAFASRLVPVRPRAFNSHAFTGNRMFDSQFHGLYLTDRGSLPHQQLELYALLRRNRHAGDRVQTWGLRDEYRHAGWDAEAEIMLQTGSYGFLRHRAWALHAGAGRALGAGWHLGAAYNFGSGDDGSPGTHRTFDNLYPLNHAYYGYMDLFALQNLHNAEAVLRWRHGQQTLRLAWEEFWLDHPGSDAWYNAGAGVVRPGRPGVSSHVGGELDLTLARRFPAWHLDALLGFSHFFAGGFVRDTGPSRDANSMFVQGKYTF